MSHLIKGQSSFLKLILCYKKTMNIFIIPLTGINQIVNSHLSHIQKFFSSMSFDGQIRENNETISTYIKTAHFRSSKISNTDTEQNYKEADGKYCSMRSNIIA